jgi:DNA polymerase-1
MKSLNLRNQNYLLDPQTSVSDNQEFQLFLKLAHLPEVKRLHIDTESNGGNLKDGRGFGTGISIDISPDGLNAYSYYFPFRHPRDNLSSAYLDKLKDLIENGGKTAVMQFARHDIRALKTFGITVPFDFECTMLIAHSVNENLFSYSLDSLSKGLGYEGKAKDKHFEQVIKLMGWGNVPPSFLGEYAATDASLLRPIINHYREIYDQEDETDGELWKHDKEIQLVLNSMEDTGIMVDLKLAEIEVERGEKRMAELANDIGLNPGSTSQLSELLFDRLGLVVNPNFVSEKTGKPSLNKKALEYYEEKLEELGSPVARQVLEYRGFQKAVSSYWRSYLDKVSPDGRIRPNFNLHRTTTKRLSANDPNTQNIPRITEHAWNNRVKQGFITDDDHELWEADYSQIEMRMFAAYGHQTNLIEIFEDSTRDLFTEMSEAMNLPRPDLKTSVYAWGYGAGVDRLAMILGSIEKAYRFKNGLASNYPGFQQATDLATRTAKGQGFVRYWSKRRRHFANPQAEGHKAMNAVLQGGAADIIKRQMVRLWKGPCELNLNPECKMLLQVHDSVVFEIQKGKVDKYKPEIINIMEDVKPDFGVPFRVDFHRWGH